MTKILHRCLLFLLLLAFVGAAAPALAIERGEPAPDFTLKTLDGRDVSLSDYRGRIIVLKLATTWCPTCKQQTNDIFRLEPLLIEHNAVVLEVFVQDSERMVRRYLKKKNPAMTFEALMDDASAHRAYNVYLIPRMVIIDRDLRVFHDSGQLSEKELRQLIEEVAALPAGS